jgi:anti-sigma B factor antagonist
MMEAQLLPSVVSGGTVSASLEFIDWEIDGVVVLNASGRLVLGEATTRFRECIRQLIERGNIYVVLNLKDVHHIDSSGLGELVTAYTTLKKRGGAIKLLNLTPHGQDLMQLTKLYTIFEIFTDEDEATRSFGPVLAGVAPVPVPNPS